MYFTTLLIMKKVLIMGASSGIGLRVAEEFASRGVMVGMAARHTAPMAELQKKYPETVVYESIDVTRTDAPDRMKKLITAMGGMDIYFHVAGIGYENLGLDPQREVDIIATNSGGFARMICCAYRYFRDNGLKGRIAAVTSVAGTNGIGRLSAYSASKKCAQTYLVALEQLANAENADVTFTDIRPGWIRTPLLRDDVAYPMEMTLDYAVPLIIRAIVRHPRVAVIDWKWNLLVALWRLLPNFLWTKVDMEISKPDFSLPSPGKEPFPETAVESKEKREV